MKLFCLFNVSMSEPSGHILVVCILGALIQHVKRSFFEYLFFLNFPEMLRNEKGGGLENHYYWSNESI